MGFQLFSVMSAMAQMRAGSLGKKQYEQRARHEKLKARIEAVNAKKRGVEALRRANSSLASIIAGAGRQGLQAAGSVVDRGVFLVARPASEDLASVAFNASMSLYTGEMRAADNRLAGQQAQLQGFIQAGSTMANMYQQQSYTGFQTKSVAPGLN